MQAETGQALSSTKDLVEELFLQQAAGNKRSHRRQQPFDPPQLDSLPVNDGSDGEKDADCQSLRQDRARRQEMQ